jgi:hypothetical protein
MRNSFRLLFGAIFLAASTLAAGYALAGSWLGGVVAFIWAGLWVISIVRQTFNFASLALIGYSILIINAHAVGVGAVWLLLTLIGALAGWDLEYLLVRLLDVEDEAVADQIAATHNRKLGVTLALGLAVAGITLGIRYQISFWLVLVISILAILGVTRFIALVRQPHS